MMSFIILVGVALPRLVSAQSNTGTLEGTVVDPSARTIAGASVTVRSQAGQSLYQASTNNKGEFTISGIPSGSYTVEVSAPGFSIAPREGVSIGTDKAT